MGAKMKCGGRKFTLIELITVIAIAAVLASLVGAAFSSIGRGNDVNAASSEIGNALNLAKAQAASRRQYVAVIFVENPDEALQNLLPRRVRDRKFGAYRLAYVKKTGTSGVFAFKGWLPSSEWRALPGSTILLAVEVNKTASDPIPDSTPTDNYESGAVRSVTGVKLGNTTVNMECVVFSPRGALEPPAALRFTVADVAEWNGNEVVFENDADTSVAQNVRFVLVNKYTGVVKYEDPQ